MIGIEINEIDFHNVNVTFFFLISFRLYSVDNTAFCTSAYPWEMVNLVALQPFLPTCWAMSGLRLEPQYMHFCLAGVVTGVCIFI